MLTSPVTLPASASSYELSAAPNLPSDEQAAAKKLESVFLSMLIKEMRESSSEEGLFPGDSAGVQGGIFDMMMGDFLAENSPGIGISRYLLASEQGEIPSARPVSQPADI